MKPVLKLMLNTQWIKDLEERSHLIYPWIQLNGILEHLIIILRRQWQTLLIMETDLKG